MREQESVTREQEKRDEGDEKAIRGGRKSVAMQGWQRRDAEEITSPPSWRYIGTQFQKAFQEKSNKNNK